MAHSNATTQQRNLSLTEELERLEQSITLTLQEIDHNFSKAHRIVTSSILPIVEQYANHSKDVWEGSKFWKQFFESSANVSLSGYEEQQSTHEGAEETVTEDSHGTTHTTLDEEETSGSYETPSAQHISTSSIADIDLSNLTISPSHSTPRPNKKQAQPTFAGYPSPYEALRQEVHNTTAGSGDASSISRTADLPETPGRKLTIDDVAMTPQESPQLPRNPASAIRPSTTRKRTDPLLHKVLDRTYRIQATPLTANRYNGTRTAAGTTTPGTSNRTRTNAFDSTLSSSPEVAPPQLHAEIFGSPERRRSPKKAQQRTPGVSVLTPAHGNAYGKTGSHRTPAAWDSDEDDDEHGSIDEATGVRFGASPPKTMQFHIPQSRLLKTPAKEASQRIVKDILETAGVRGGGGGGQDDTDDLDDIDIDVNLDLNFDDDNDEDDYIDGAGYGHGYGHDPEPTSPSVVRKAAGLEDETF